nr:olfactory receptor 10V1-like [Kogia breviceps]
MRPACADTHRHEAALCAISAAAVAIPLLLTCLSCGCTVAAIVRMDSAQGKRRAFSTCSSHLVFSRSMGVEIGSCDPCRRVPKQQQPMSRAVVENGGEDQRRIESRERGQRLCHQQARRIEYVEGANQTGMIHFHFHPFSKLPEVRMLIFVTFLITYLVNISGHLSISLIIWIGRSLHAPVYFFLANLAALEICYSSTVAPLTLTSTLSVEKTLISLPGCGAQMSFFIFLGSADCIPLAVMAYARARGVLFPQPRIEPAPPAVEAWSLNRWTTREVPTL